jgi:hypothetical protein
MGNKTRGLLSGPKFNGKHTTLIAAAETVVKVLRADSRVTKIVIGIIKTKRGGSYNLKATEILAGLRIVVSTPTNIQELFAYTNDQASVRQELEALSLP